MHHYPGGEALTAVAALSPSILPASLAGRLDGASSGSMGSGGGVGSWDWNSELQAFGGRIIRGRADEAAAARRSTEEAERAVLRRLEDSERRVLRCQEEETSALQRLLSNWNAALDTRFERQSAQLEAYEKRFGEELVKAKEDEDSLRTEMQRVTDETASAHGRLREELQEQIREQVQEMLRERLDALQVEMVSSQEQLCEQLQVNVLDKTRQHLAEGLEALGKEVAEDANRREAETRSTLSALTSRLGVTEARSDAADQHLAERLEPDVDAMKERCKTLGGEVLELHRKLTSFDEDQKRCLTNLEDLEANEHRNSTAVREQFDRLESLQEARESWQETRVVAVTEAASEARQQLGAELRRAAGSASNTAVLRAEEHAERMFAAKGEEVAREASVRLRAQVAMLEDRLQSSQDANEVAREVGRAGISALRSELRSYLGAQSTGQQSESDLKQEFHARVEENTAELHALMSDCSRLTEEFNAIRCSGLSHEWAIPRCMQRLRYLSLATEPGLWLDSDPFSLGPVGPMTLRLYPRGLRSGDGQCALALRLPAAANAPPPLLVELAVGDMGRRVGQGRDPEGGGTIWLAESLGDLGVHTGGSDAADLSIRAQFPALQAGLAISRATISGEERMPPDVGSPKRDDRQMGQSPQAPNFGSAAGLASGLAQLRNSVAALPSSRGSARDSRGVPSEQVVGSPYAAATFNPALRGSPPGSASSLSSFATFDGRRPVPSPEAFGTAPARFGSNGGPSSPIPEVATIVGPAASLRGMMMEGNPSGNTGGAAFAQPSLTSTGSGRLMQQAGPGTPQPSVAQQRARLEQRARAAFEMPSSVHGSSPDSEFGGGEMETAPTSPTNPFDDVANTLAAEAQSANPFEPQRPAPALAPAGAANAT